MTSERPFHAALARYLHEVGGGWDQLAARLAWQYGVERAEQILRGMDEATNADQAAWRKFGAGGRDV